MHSIVLKGSEVVRPRAASAPPAASGRPLAPSSARQTSLRRVAKPSGAQRHAAAAAVDPNLGCIVPARQLAGPQLHVSAAPAAYAVAGSMPHRTPRSHLRAALVQSHEIEASECTSGSDTDDAAYVAMRQSYAGDGLPSAGTLHQQQQPQQQRSPQPRAQTLQAAEQHAPTPAAQKMRQETAHSESVGASSSNHPASRSQHSHPAPRNQRSSSNAARTAPSLLGLTGGLAALLVLLPAALLLGKLAAVPGASSLAAVAAGGPWPQPAHLAGAGMSAAMMGAPTSNRGGRGALQPAHAALSSGAGPAPGSDDTGGGVPIRLVSVVNAGLQSPFKGASWGEVMQHNVQRLAWSDERFQMRLFSQQELQEDPAARSSFQAAVTGTPIFFAIGITDPSVADLLADATASVPSALFFDSTPQLNSLSRVDGYAPAAATAWQSLAARVGWSKEGRAGAVMATLQDLWGRYTSDDLLFMWLVLLNEYTTTVPSVANTAKGIDLPSLQCMAQHCASQIFACVTDAQCKAGLDCLQACAFNDQVAQYRCVASHESPKFEAFALCVLQLHNCRGLTAAIPMKPDPAPMTSWRGAPMTHEAAEDLFLGHWQQVVEGGKQRYSWLVAGGKNPAYDAFPCQHQLFYKGKSPGVMWYEPVFKVNTLDGRQVWRRRKYRVRRGKAPGTFHLSALDNGVTSNEFWRILDCADVAGGAIPEWCLFYYSGAAAAAGLSYNGAVLASADGLWPAEQHTERIEAALDRAGIKPFELSSVDNSGCADAPLHALGLARA